MQFFIDSEIAKKEEKDRIIHDRQVSSVMAAKKTKSWDDELRDDTKITESAGEFLSLYFLREKVVMEKVRTCSTLQSSNPILLVFECSVSILHMLITKT